MSGLGELSREELLALVAAQARTIEELKDQNAALTARLVALEAENAELKRQLGQSSRNSSKPPSTDVPEQGVPPRSLRRKTGRKSGKQPGAQGFSLSPVGDPDEVIDHVPLCCRDCGTGLTDAASAGVVRRQVRDVAQAVVTIIEHRLHQCRCGCGQVTTAAAPAQVAAAPVSYGPNLRSWVAVLVEVEKTIRTLLTAARILHVDETGAKVTGAITCG